MRDAGLYKEANENNFALRLRDDGAYLVNLDTAEVEKIVTVDESGIKSTVPSTWKDDFARRLARMMKAEVDKLNKESEGPELPGVSDKNK